jgi:hypothetical protein
MAAGVAFALGALCLVQTGHAQSGNLGPVSSASASVRVSVAPRFDLLNSAPCGPIQSNYTGSYRVEIDVPKGASGQPHRQACEVVTTAATSAASQPTLVMIVPQ